MKITLRTMIKRIVAFGKIEDDVKFFYESLRDHVRMSMPSIYKYIGVGSFKVTLRSDFDKTYAKELFIKEGYTVEIREFTTKYVYGSSPIYFYVHHNHNIIRIVCKATQYA